MPGSGTSRPPFVDEHALELAVPRERAWPAVLALADSLTTGRGGLLRRVLAPAPPAGFALAAAEPDERVELAGRHRFARYVLVLELSDAAPGTTRVCARTFAEFPGVRGRVYRALVLGTRLHVLVTRRLLRSLRRRLA